jgi:hypothetical protein
MRQGTLIGIRSRPASASSYGGATPDRSPSSRSGASAVELDT